MSHGQREARESDRIRAATSRAQASAGSAMDAALAQIGAAFGEAAAIFDFKLRVERVLCRGPQHPAVRARFGARAERLCGHDLDGAIMTVERWWRDERKAFQIAAALGRGNRLSIDVLGEIRLILRLIRFKRMHREFGRMIAAVCGEELAEAAE
jgi:hypothetical protein